DAAEFAFSHVAWSDDARQLSVLVGYGKTKLLVLKAETGDVVLAPQEPLGAGVVFCRWSPKGAHLLLVGEHLAFYDFAKNKAQLVVQDRMANSELFAWSPKFNLVSCSQGEQGEILEFRQASTGRIVARMQPFPAGSALWLSPDGHYRVDGG